ncbi:MAG: EMC3/TMCO1 family protein [Candidatus Methanomethylophilus sp.]|nr:EMC3/TMCO1 family protein [Methanomethylophilus sp.]MDD4221714.1 EMC3/TMCO1 family protein [Methanomethylophilus sp.]
MANPGSPEQMRAVQNSMGNMMPKGTMTGMLLTMLIMMATIALREPIGKYLNYVFKYIDFQGQYPVLTLVIGGLLMVTFGTVVRALMTDPIAQAKTQHIQSDFQNEMRKARTENNLYKMKKLQEMQPQMMQASMQQSTAMMKMMPVSMLLVFPVYAWVYYFISNTVPVEFLTIIMPWGFACLTDTVLIMPLWIIVYTLISLPMGQLENKLVNYMLLRRRLKKLDAGEA